MGKLSTIAIVWLRCMQPTKLGLLLGHLTTTTAITTLVYLQAMIGNGVLLNCTNAYGRSASSFKEVNDGTPHKLPATTLIPHECKDEDTCVFIFALRNLTELDTGNYICSSLSHIYHLNVTGSPEGYHCSYAYHCMMSCFDGGKRKTELVTIFSLCLNEQERGRETMITRVCSSPLRDRRKVLGNVDPQKRPRLSASPTPPPPPPTYSHLPANLSSEPHPMLETDGTPDEDGYYSFTWKVKDKGVFNMLQLMKAGYECHWYILSLVLEHSACDTKGKVFHLYCHFQKLVIPKAQRLLFLF
ncbi:hypothetical protein EMCRGX_G002497 [Ephydatia muelleri]